MAQRVQPVQPRELGHQHRGLPLGHAVVARKDVVFVPLPLAQPTDVVDRPALLGQRGIIGSDRPALARGHVLRVLEAESRRSAKAADLPSPPGGSVGLCAVLHDEKPAPAGDLRDPVHVRGVAREVHRDHSLCPRRDCSLDARGVQAVGRPLDVGKHGRCADHEHGGGRGDERPGGDDDLVAGPDVQRPQDDLEGRGPAAHRKHPRDAEVAGEALLESRDLGAEGAPAAACAHARERPPFLPVGPGPRGEGPLPHGCASPHCKHGHQLLLIAALPTGTAPVSGRPSCQTPARRHGTVWTGTRPAVGRAPGRAPCPRH